MKIEKIIGRENSDSTSSQFSKAMEASLQSLTSLLRKSQEVKRA